MQSHGLIVVFYPQFHGVHGIARYLDSWLRHVVGGVALVTARGAQPAPRFAGVEVIELPAPDNRLGLAQWAWRARQVLHDLDRRSPIEAINLHIPPLIPALLLPRRWPVVLTAHTTYLGMSGGFEDHAHFASPWPRASVALKRWMEHRILARADHVITLTEQGRQELARYGRHDGVTVIPNGVDLQAFQPKAATGDASSPAPDIDVLFCGRIEKRKGSRPMVEVCRRLVAAEPSVRIGIVGVGDDDAFVRSALAPLAPQVTWFGRLPLHEMPALYRRGRIYASTSYYEGLPGTALEAMACGLPAVVWDRAFYDGLVIDGRTGWRVAVNDVDAMVTRLKVLMHDADTCMRMGRHANEQVHAHHDWRRLAPQLLQVCRDTAAGTPPRLKVTWAGLRGVPGVQGGVEAHAEQLCPRLQALGCDVTVIGRRGFQDPGRVDEDRTERDQDRPRAWKGVHRVTLWAPRHKHLEALVHTGLAVLHAGLVRRPDVLHLHAIGPSLWTPLARLLGLRVVVTHHGADDARQKWGPLARAALRTGEAFAARWAHALIVISGGIQRDVARRRGRVGVLIPNGIAPHGAAPPPSVLAPFGLVAQRYVLLVSRLVPEKRHRDLIDAFARARPSPGWQLVLTGSADHDDAYASAVRDAAASVPGVVMTGFQTGPTLQALFAHAGLFVLPSSHEGLPIALLEALSWGCPVLASDIEAHRELGLSAAQRFPVGDVATLAHRLQAWVTEPPPGRGAERISAQPVTLGAEADRLRDLRERYDWERIARQTLQVYERVAQPRPSGAGSARTNSKARS